MVGIFVMTVLTVAPGRDNLLEMGALLIVACFLHSMGGFLLGYWVCRVVGMDKVTCRTISLEVGLQNAGMASGIAAELKKVATLGLAPIVFGPVMNITASTIANWWRNSPVQGDESFPVNDTCDETPEANRGNDGSLQAFRPRTKEEY